MSEDFSTLKLGPEASSALENFIDGSAALGDTFSQNSDSVMTDIFQKALEIDCLDDFAVFEQAHCSQGVDPAAIEVSRSSSSWVPIPMQTSSNQQSPTSPQVVQEAASWAPSTLKIQQEPSKWAPVSSQLQQHLNMNYASQLIQNLKGPNPAPVLYFPAHELFTPPTSSIQSLPNSAQAGYNCSQSLPSSTEILSIDPSSTLYASTELRPQQLPTNHTNSLIPQDTDDEAPNAEVPALNATKKRGIDTDESRSEPSAKRTRTA